MFVDEVKVFARAGHGGKGAVAFHREAYIPKGGPSGGNGGRGGSVILEASHDLNNLIHQFYQPRLIAENGHHGMGKGMDGLAGRDLVIQVPCGTVVWRLPPMHPPASPPAADAAPDAGDREPGAEAAWRLASAGRPVIRSGARALEIRLDRDATPPEAPPRVVRERGDLVCDLTRHGERFVLCIGGRGGLGNRNFATSVRQAPRFAQPGEPGSEGDFLFELRLVADVGIVGYPNAGKSTLLTAISKARPKIAAYPFTTLTPKVGIVEYPDHRRLTLCDVPGLIAGAHANVGLGHKFLRHVARCKALILLLDMAGSEGRAPWDDYRSLLEELELYDPALLEKPRLVVANKMDESNAEANLRAFKRKIRKMPVLPISAAFDEGIPALLKAIRELTDETA
ncbi:MAG: GTPase ObgE [Verrucomicrobiae bacterium]|nr:GTPase ObgE [Verrucomicrobiae bacterium]